MKKVLLSYKTQIRLQPETAHRKQVWYENEQGANKAIINLLKKNQDVDSIIKYSEFRVTTATIVQKEIRKDIKKILPLRY